MIKIDLKMKRKSFFLQIFSILFLFPQFVISQSFNKGVNLTNWFQASSSTSIHFGKYNKQDFVNIKSLGCDVIRLPINMHQMTNGSPDYKVDTLLFHFLDQVIDWTEELNVNLILDNHSFDPAVNTSADVENVLIPVWKQFAERYKDRSEYIFYEILNEPHGINDNIWNTIQQKVINEIRKIDSVHTIIVGPAGWNSFHNLKHMPEYSDTNLIYTFHFYDPFIFTHQGASWTDPSMVDLANVPFPYSQPDMPNLPSSLSGTWVQSNFNNYSVDGSVSKVKELIDIAVDFKETRNVELFCGEFGVYIPNSNNDDRVYWYEIVRKYLEEKGISWTIWDYQGGFGIFEKGSDELFESDLNIPLVLALGLNEVDQTNHFIKPDSANIPIYGDFIENGISENSWISNGQLNFYSEDAPIEGSYCISVSNIAQYNRIGFNFTPNRNLEYLFENTDSYLSFYVKGDSPNIQFDIRFLDSKTDVPEDHPWRMSYTIDNSKVEFDGNWYKLEIALVDFFEQGSWDNNIWYDPIGAFDWQDIDHFEIVAEHNSLDQSKLWFDDIKIVNPNIVDIGGNFIGNDFHLYQNYPNPFNPSTNIRYTIPSSGNTQHSNLEFVSLIIYDVLGREVAPLVNENQNPGKYIVNWDATNYPSGVYFYKLKYGDFIQTKRMIFIK